MSKIPPRNYKKLNILEPLDPSYNDIDKAMAPLYSNTLFTGNLLEEIKNQNLSHLNQKLSYNKEDCDKMYVGINTFKNLEGKLEDNTTIELFKEVILMNKYKFENKIVKNLLPCAPNLGNLKLIRSLVGRNVWLDRGGTKFV